MEIDYAREAIKNGKTSLGIEFGSTRIKAVLIDEAYTVIASGNYEWENRLEQGIWTYSLDEVWTGLQSSYRDMAEQVKQKYDIVLTKIGTIGFSAMMHGYLVFDQWNELLVPFRTWRNSITKRASEELTKLFEYNIPQRWSIAHLYQAILNDEEHVKDIAFMTTLAGYVHWKLTGKKVLGIGDASGMFPIDIKTKNYDEGMIRAFEQLIAEKNYNWRLKDILPEIMLAGEAAGALTKEGAELLDPTGKLEAGVPVCPPEGDAETGMVATNSVARRTGNVSAGTSVFAIIILEEELSKVYPEIDLVTTPEGHLAANIHVNNGTSDLNAWVSLFGEFAEGLGISCDKDRLFEILYRQALEGDEDCGGLLAYGFYSGETIIHVPEGRPLFVRTPDSKFTLANFMRAHLFSSMSMLKVGVDLLKQENVRIDTLTGHGGLFKTTGVAQRFLAAALGAPVSVMEHAGEGGAWGMALLAAYMLEEQKGELQAYLEKVFSGSSKIVMNPDEKEMAGFERYIEKYRSGIQIEREAVDSLS
ncbi:MAG: FGGY-family carbohydrate kinase [Lachnospiraceae bacterium]|nr:FGGY-family carbohydrate kinase [Lachnospiraceae bacterium]